MSLSLQECVRKVKQAYPDLRPYAYVEFHGCYIFNLIEPGIDPSEAIADFHIVSPEDGEVSGSIPTLLMFKNDEFNKKWRNAILVSDTREEVSHSSQSPGYRVRRSIPDNGNFLVHHGIPGQHWGDRNGPPYPLDAKTHNEVVKGSSANKPKDKRVGDLSPEAIEAISYASVIAMFSAYVYAHKRIFHRKQSTANEELSKDFIGDIADVGKKFSNDNPPKLIKGAHSEADDMAAVNPKYYNGSIKATSNNCALCAFTYDLRRRGYDVTANVCKTGMYPDRILKDLYIGGKQSYIYGRSFTSVYDKAAKIFPEGSRGEFSAYGYYGGGHAMAFEIKNGKTIVRCPQSNMIITPADLSKYGFDPTKCRFARTDNLEVRLENIHSICSELKPNWKQTVAKEMKEKNIASNNSKKQKSESIKKAAGRRDLMTESEKRKSLEKQWKREHKGQKMDAEARKSMDNWVKGNMWSAPWEYGQNSLMHYGVKGQHWGVRNYQNKDGTLTSEGKIHYSKSVGSERKRHKASDKVEGMDKTRAVKRPNGEKWKPSDAENLSDKELNDRNSRLQRERQYKEMTESAAKKKAKKVYNDYVKDSLKKIFIGTATTLAVVAMKKNYEKLFNLIKNPFADLNLLNLR